MLGSDVIKPGHIFGHEHCLYTGHLAGGCRIAFQNPSPSMRRAHRPDLQHVFACGLIVGVDRAASYMLMRALMRQRAREELTAWSVPLSSFGGEGWGGEALQSRVH